MPSDAPHLPDDEGRLASAINRACHFVDWWFTPRLRALITWTVVAAALAAAFDQWSYASQFALIDRLLGGLLGVLPPSVLGFLKNSAIIGLATLFYCSIQPIALRLGWWRTVLWLSLWVLGTPLRDATPSGSLNSLVGLIFCAALASTLIGRRSRPWLFIVASPPAILAHQIMLGAAGPLANAYWLAWGAANFVFAVILLYGTEPLERGKEAPRGNPGAPG